MKSIIRCILFLLIGHGVMSQSKNSTSADSLPIELQRELFIYGMALKYNDAVVAKTALYRMLSMTPGNTAIMDSLAILYFDYEQFASAALVSQDVATLNPKDMFATEIAAVSFENLGVKDKALLYYEKLYLNRNDLGLLYQMAFLQMELKRFNEAITNSDIILQSKEADQLKLIFPKGDNQQQQITLRGATYRLKAQVAIDMGKTDEAKQHLNKALEIHPDFELAKQMLTSLPK